MDKKIKLVLVNYYIFYFKKSGNSYLFKKIIPIFSLFAKKHTIDNLTLLTFSSTLHNFDKQYSFICENEDDTDKFFQWFNKNIHHKDINEYFSFKCELGKGKFGHVFLAERLRDKKLFAIKIVLKCNPTEEEYKINRWESTIFNCLHNIKNENIIKTIQRYESETKIFFVFEYVKGSDLKTYIKSNEYNQNIYSLTNLINITFQILNGVKCLHKYGIIHRDIKSANIMVNQDYTNDSKGTPKDSVKLVDFGLSRILGKYEYSDDPYGSLCFKAPELIKHIKYNFKVDIWAVGVTLFYMIYGELPFEKGDKEEIKNSIISEPVSYYSNNIISDFNYINDLSEVDDIYITRSSVLYSIMKDCLEKKQDKRFSIEQLIKKYVTKFEW
jgi:serine/threonine protein kinase